MDNVLISVVIPAYNRGRLLGDALESVFAQGIDRVEAIVVDDGSTDDTRQVMTGLRARFQEDRVQYLHQSRQGAGAARNRGLAMARGVFVAFLDSDDVWFPGKLATELALFARHPQVDAVISDSEFWSEGKLVAGSRFRLFGVELPDGRDACFLADLAPVWIEKSLFSTCCLTLRRSALDRIGMFDPFLRSHEDWEFELRMYHTCQVVIHPEVTARVRRFDDGTRGERGSDRDFLHIQYRILDRMRSLPPLSPQATERSWARRRELASRLAATARGAERLECLPLIASELREGAVSNAARILALGLRPARDPA
ncbi:MAG TPA: glycosyltransferase family A protein [Thermoanaerobaculia bacterium]|nr:glycosyltransferase family A protein [Thermoanaerobaculia bacterium]